VSTSPSPPTPTGRRKAAAQSSRRKLLDAALEHFAGRPYDEVVASDITESAGVANGLLFHHFDSKRGIYHEALAEAVRALHAACAVDDDAPPGRQTRELLTRHLTYLAENQSLALNVILNRTGPSDATEAFEATRWDVIVWATEILGLDGGNPSMQFMWRTFGAAADEATIRWLRDNRPYPIAVLVEALVEILVGALRGAAAIEPELRVTRAVAALRRAQPTSG
jgi:AcrR family transcriptional regulator